MVRSRALFVLVLGVACRQSSSTNDPPPTPSTSASVADLAAAPAPSFAIASATASVAPVASLPPPTNVTSAAKQQRCVEAARACAKALITGDNQKTADCMPNQALALAGGREATIAEMLKGKAQMSRDGVSFDRADIDPPHDLVLSGGLLFAVLPQRVTMKVPQGKLVQESFLVGVSSEDGVTWRFVDGSSLNQNNVRRVFPTFPSTLVLPVVSEPHRAR